MAQLFAPKGIKNFSLAGCFPFSTVAPTMPQTSRAEPTPAYGADARATLDTLSKSLTAPSAGRHICARVHMFDSVISATAKRPGGSGKRSLRSLPMVHPTRKIIGEPALAAPVCRLVNAEMTFCRCTIPPARSRKTPASWRDQNRSMLTGGRSDLRRARDRLARLLHLLTNYSAGCRRTECPQLIECQWAGSGSSTATWYAEFGSG
jgi:hypothetical protein